MSAEEILVKMVVHVVMESTATRARVLMDTRGIIVQVTSHWFQPTKCLI